MTESMTWFLAVFAVHLIGFSMGLAMYPFKLVLHELLNFAMKVPDRMKHTGTAIGLLAMVSWFECMCVVGRVLVYQCHALQMSAGVMPVVIGYFVGIYLLMVVPMLRSRTSLVLTFCDRTLRLWRRQYTFVDRIEEVASWER